MRLEQSGVSSQSRQALLQTLLKPLHGAASVQTAQPRVLCHLANHAVSIPTAERTSSSGHARCVTRRFCLRCLGKNWFRGNDAWFQALHSDFESRAEKHDEGGRRMGRERRKGRDTDLLFAVLRHILGERGRLCGQGTRWITCVLLRDDVNAAACLTHVHAVNQTVPPCAVQFLRRASVVSQQKTGAHQVAAYRSRHPAVLLVVFVRCDKVSHPCSVGHQAAVGAHAQQLHVLFDALALLSLALDRVEIPAMHPRL
jgi:hypothetical protein